MGRWIRRTLWILACLVAAWAPTSSAQESADRATFTYDLGSHAQGAVDGTCEARALVPVAAGELSILSDAARLRFVQVWINYTLLLPEGGQPVYHELNAARREHAQTLSGDVLQVSWPASGRASILERNARDGGATPFRAAFEASSLELGTASVNHGPEMPDKAMPNPLLEPRGALEGRARALRAEGGHWDASGDVSIYLEQAVVQDASGLIALPSYVETSQSGGPGMRIVSEHYRYAWLDVDGASARLASEAATLYCATVALHVDGGFTAYGASGRSEQAGVGRDFARQELTLVGLLDLSEEFERDGASGDVAETRSEARGRFDAVGIDFTIANEPARTWPTVVTVTASGLGLAALAVFILYSRIAEDQILDRPERRRLYETVVANPGIEFARLLETNPMSATNARYHLKLLERRGLLRVVNVQGRHRYVASNLDANQTRQALLLSEDPKLRALLEHLNGEARPASELVERLRRDWGLSRTGGWKVLDRAVRAQLVERLVHHRRVMVRRAS